MKDKVVFRLPFERHIEKRDHEPAGITYEHLVERGVAAALAYCAVGTATGEIVWVNHIGVTYACRDYVVARSVVSSVEVSAVLSFRSARHGTSVWAVLRTEEERFASELNRLVETEWIAVVDRRT